MSTRKRAYKYRCDNDCLQSGCPGHVMRGLLQDTSDVVIISDEKGEVIYSGDINQTNALLDMLHSLDYRDGIYFPTIIGITDEDSFIDTEDEKPNHLNR